MSNEYRLSPRIFKVTIAGGFVSQYTPGTWVSEDPEHNEFPSTWESSLDREYARARWEYIGYALSERSTPTIYNVSTIGASNSVIATSVEFIVMYERSGYIFTNDELNGNLPMGPADAFDPMWVHEGDGRHYILATEEDVIARNIARGLSSSWTMNRTVYNPGVSGEGGHPSYGQTTYGTTIPKAYDTVELATPYVTVERIV